MATKKKTTTKKGKPSQPSLTSDAQVSEEFKASLNDPAFVADQCAALSTDDFVILNGITEERKAELAYMAAHSESEELKAHCARIAKNAHLYL